MSHSRMKQKVQQVLATIGASPTLQSSLKNKGYIFSAYVSTLIAEALRPSLQVKVKNPDGGPFRFPMAPAEVYSRNFSWYEIQNLQEGSTYEMHLCCTSEGVSGVLHELDIAIIPEDVASRCRTSRGSSTKVRPATSDVMFLVECKNVGAVELSLAREFCGLCFEFPVRLPHYSGWRGDRVAGLASFATTLPPPTRMRSAFQLLQAKKRSRNFIAEPCIEPGQPAAVQDFQKQIADVLIPVLK